MTPEQVEKVRDELNAVAAHARENVDHFTRFKVTQGIDNWTPVLQRIAAAIAALNGEPREEAWVGTGLVIFATHGKWIATCLDEATAQRIAHLPALERAARDLLRTAVIPDDRDDSHWLPGAVKVGPIRAIRAALTHPEE